VVAGGREPPQWESYPAHQFIHNVGMVPCSGGGCWRSRIKPLGDGNERDAPNQICQNVLGDLPHCRDLITTDDVIRRVEGYFRGGAANFLTAEQAQVTARAVVDRRGCNDRKLPGAPGDTASSKNGWVRNGAPESEERLTVVTLNDEVMAPVARITSARLREYAKLRRYPLLHYEKLFDPSRPAAWSKIRAVRSALLSRQSEWVMWLDADAIVMNLEFPATRLIDHQVDLIFASDQNGLNSGIFLIRNCDWSLRFLESADFLGEVHLDPDGYNPLWEQSTFKHLIRNFVEVEARIKILPQAVMNSSRENYRHGDFILHLAGLTNEERLKTLATLPLNRHVCLEGQEVPSQ